MLSQSDQSLKILAWDFALDASLAMWRTLPPPVVAHPKISCSEIVASNGTQSSGPQSNWGAVTHPKWMGRMAQCFKSSSSLLGKHCGRDELMWPIAIIYHHYISSSHIIIYHHHISSYINIDHHMSTNHSVFWCFSAGMDSPTNLSSNLEHHYKRDGLQSACDPGDDPLAVRRFVL